MRRSWMLTMAALLVGFGLPALLMESETGSSGVIAPQLTVPESPGEEKVEGDLRVLWEDGTVREMELNDYLTGVLLAELPMSFHEEARKAQAVVSRTYTLRRVASPRHEEADICTDSTCCQGWKNPADQENADLALAAIQATEGQVLTYGGELIDATFFSCSGGRTEAAVEVWGSDVPYLQSVESPGEAAPHNEDTQQFTKEEFRSLILAAAPEAELSGNPADWFGSVTSTVGGGVEELEIGGVTFTGTELRSILGLRSTVFAVSTSEEQIIFQTRGFGHRVGMSQYGAEAMARSGSTYEEILLHYYAGVSLAGA